MRDVGGRRAIDVHAEKAGKGLFVDVKAGRSYHIRGKQLNNLLKFRGNKKEVGFAYKMDGKFYLFTLKEILGPSSKQIWGD